MRILLSAAKCYGQFPEYKVEDSTAFGFSVLLDKSRMCSRSVPWNVPFYSTPAQLSGRKQSHSLLCTGDGNSQVWTPLLSRCHQHLTHIGTHLHPFPLCPSRRGLSLPLLTSYATGDLSLTFAFWPRPSYRHCSLLPIQSALGTCFGLTTGPSTETQTNGCSSMF